MAYTTTIDERYGGGWLSQDAGVFDAPYQPLFSPSFVLAENDIGYGFLTDAYYTSDIDVYSLV